MFVMTGQDAKELADFYANESIHNFNDMIHYESIHLNIKLRVNRFKMKKFHECTYVNILIMM